MKKLPKIILHHSKLLEPFFNFYVQNCPDVKGKGWKEWVPPDAEKMEKRISAYRNIWAKYEEKVLNGICSALGLSFDRDLIDVFIVAGINRSMSNPVIIGSQYLPNNFIITLTHELIHLIFRGTNFKFRKILLIRGKNSVVDNHILVYAILRKIFKEEPKILKVVADIKYDKDYKKAYELSRPYEKILKFFRENK